MTAAPMESWGSGDAYERYVGRWSRKVAVELLRWLAPARGLSLGGRRLRDRRPRGDDPGRL